MFHLLFSASLPVLGGKERFVTVSFFTFGCKVNQYETQYLARCFAKEGYQIVEGETAQVLVINSCTVTGMSDKKARQLLHRLRRKNPDSILVLCGCFPQAFPGTSRRFGGRRHHRQHQPGPAPCLSGTGPKGKGNPASPPSGRRAF